MKKTVFLLLFSIIYLISFSQTQQLKSRKGNYLGAGFSLGIFNPKDVNTYLQDYYDNQVSGYPVDVEYGSPNMNVNFVLQVCGGVFLTKQFELKGIFEVAFAPKVIAIRETKFFAFTRYSPGILFNYHIPSSKKNNFMVSGGLLYHKMKFEKWKTSTFGPRLKVGYNINNNKYVLEIYVAYDFAEGKTNLSGIEYLNYSGFLFGINIKF